MGSVDVKYLSFSEIINTKVLVSSDILLERERERETLAYIENRAYIHNIAPARQDTQFLLTKKLSLSLFFLIKFTFDILRRSNMSDESFCANSCAKISIYMHGIFHTDARKFSSRRAKTFIRTRENLRPDENFATYGRKFHYVLMKIFIRPNENLSMCGCGATSVRTNILFNNLSQIFFSGYLRRKISLL